MYTIHFNFAYDINLFVWGVFLLWGGFIVKCKTPLQWFFTFIAYFIGTCIFQYGIHPFI